MFDAFLKFSKALIDALPQIYELYSKHKQHEKIVELLECFFILNQLIDTADDLLSLVRDKDSIRFDDLSFEELDKHYSLVQSKLTIQLQRLQRIGDIFIDNPTIELLNPKVKRRLEHAIGTKGKGLYSIGATLFMNQMLGSSAYENESDSERATRLTKESFEFASSVTNCDGISVVEQREIVSGIKKLADEYKVSLDSLLNSEHKLLLANKAKELADQYAVRM